MRPTNQATWEATRRDRQRLLVTTLAEAFPKPAAITLEIGCGNGHYLQSFATAFPEKTCVGLDRLYGRVERASHKQTKWGIPNLSFYRAEADSFLDALPSHVAVAEVFVLFPDPWPKRKHHPHRLLQDPFLRDLAHRVETGAPLYFRTDHAEYFAWAKARLQAHSNWLLDVTAPWPHEAWTVFQGRAPHYQSLIARTRPHPTVPVRPPTDLPAPETTG